MKTQRNNKQVSSGGITTRGKATTSMRLCWAVLIGVSLGARAPATIIDTTPGVVWHLDAGLGVTYDGSGNVSAWANQSGTGSAFTQSTVSRQPDFISSVGAFNNRPVVRFTGAQDPNGDRLDATGGDWSRSLILVASPSASGDWNQLLIQRLVGGTGYYQTSLGYIWWNQWNAGVNSGTPTYYVNGYAANTSPADTPAIVEVYGNIYLGDAALGSASTYLAGVTGDIAEMAVFNRTLTSEERAAIIYNLGAKYDIPTAFTPEPSIALLLGAGGMLVWRRMRK